MVERRKVNYAWITLTVLSIVYVVLTIQINQLMEKQNNMVQDLSQVEYLSSSTQRLTRMVITGDKDDKIIFYIDEETNGNLREDSVDALSLLDNEDIKTTAQQVIANWTLLYNLFTEDISEEDTLHYIDSIKLASDNHFNSMTDLSIKINELSYLVTLEINELQFASYFSLALMLLSLGNYLISTTIALKSSSELAIIASLDVATGLYNRSKCQELFNNIYPSNREQQPAVIVIDLNDLKITNDVHGHRVGDELIQSFSAIFKEASNIHMKKPFLGRYGGDEFVVYHADVENEDDIKSFLGELSYLTEEFNKKDNRKFDISYAVGYAINQNGKDGLSIRQLFEEADENMYVHKREIKKSKQENSAPLNETSLA
ncbi:MAG: GGDEF domain-containing protein [Clostridia bacterium]